MSKSQNILNELSNVTMAGKMLARLWLTVKIQNLPSLITFRAVSQLSIFTFSTLWQRNTLYFCVYLLDQCWLRSKTLDTILFHWVYDQGWTGFSLTVLAWVVTLLLIGWAVQIDQSAVAIHVAGESQNAPLPIPQSSALLLDSVNALSTKTGYLKIVCRTNASGRHRIRGGKTV